MTWPGAGRRGSSTAATAGASDTLDQLVTQGGDAGLELVKVLGRPLGALGSGDGVAAGEGDVQDVVLAVAKVPVHRLAEAGRGERDGRLSDHGVVAVVAVFVTPDAVELDPVSYSISSL